MHFKSLLNFVLLAVSTNAAVVTGDWKLTQQGLTGVSAMMLQVVSETEAIILDKVQHNELQVDGHVAWATLFDLTTKTIRPLRPTSNTWCATGGFLGNGTMVSTAGNPREITGQNGLQAIRLFDTCSNGNCDIWEDQNVLRMADPRWYPSSLRLDDGSLLIMGGSTTLAFFSNETTNQDSYEFYPAKNIHGHNGLAIPMPVLTETVGANQYPNLHLLPDGQIFMAVKNRTLFFDWRTNTEVRLPPLPNNVKVSSPFSGSAVLLPLTRANNFTPEILICGGSTLSDEIPLGDISALDPASDQCTRMVLNAAGIARGWQVERMPDPRHMLNMILLPDGRVLITNGGRTGMAAFNTAKDRVGESNAASPVLKAVVYDPQAPAGQRFSSQGIPESPIPRMYHSTASLTPFGDIMLAGSSPSVDVSKLPPFPTEYRAEFLAPPYLSRQRPTFQGLPSRVDYGSTFALNITLPEGATSATAVLMDLGFSTHGVQMDQRSLELVSTLQGNTLRVTVPTNKFLFPPGPGFLYIVTNAGVPSVGKKVIIGNGNSPPVDPAALRNILESTAHETGPF